MRRGDRTPGLCGGPRDFETFQELDPGLIQVCHMLDLPIDWVARAASQLYRETLPDLTSGARPMPETYDLIVRGGEVVNHAGRGMADVGVRNGKFVAFGDLSRPARARCSTRAGSPSCRA